MGQKILSADWILPVSSAPVKNGSIVFDDEKILYIGSYVESVQTFPNAIKADLPGKVIIPGLVNPHTHLDFSLYKDQLVMQKDETMFDWIKRVVDLQPVTTIEMRKAGAIEGIKEMQEEKIALIGDIVHDPFSAELLEKEKFQGVCFHELSGFLPDKAKGLFLEARETVNRLSGHSENFAHYMAPHSPYAVSEELLKLIAQERQRTCFHLAESQDEVTFLKQGEPRMQKIMENLGKWDDNWQAPGCSPVRYFAALGLLHEKSIAVHMVHVEEKDYAILQATKPNICLCPRSNVWLNNGLPPAEAYLALGLNVCLATDGLGSNHDLSMLNEMRFFKKQFPKVDAATVLSMGTLNGAKALGMNKHFGALEVGRLNRMTLVSNPDRSNPYSFLDTH